MKTPFTEQPLPVDACIGDLKQALHSRHEAVLEAPPGAGKTTHVPLALLDEPWLAGKKMLMLEPRRIAAKHAAYRMASLMGESVGQTIGYRMRLESKTSPQTRIEVITEGILTRLLQQDPSLAGIGLVIFDEFHERSLDADLALSLCLKGRELFREAGNPLKLLVMSATLDTAAVAYLLDNAPVVRSAGRTYPVELIYGQAAKPGERIVERMVAALRQAVLDNPDSSILAFLPGQGEIHRTTGALGEWLLERKLRDVQLHPLYGNLTLEEQQQAIAPLPAHSGGRKVVLATNIAETSLTIEGVDVVVDSGLVREARFDPGTGMTGLHTTRISSASSIQRAGRAGRLAPGKCYRLWTEGQQEQLAAQSTPEILRADLAPLVLQLLQWGIDDPAGLSWLDKPPIGSWQQALELLETLGAIAHQGTAVVLTAHGQTMAGLPVHPRLAHLLVCGKQAGHLSTAANLAGLLSERNPFSHDNPDLGLPLDMLAGKAKCPAPQQGWLQRTRQLAQQFEATIRNQALPTGVGHLLPAAQVHGYLLACAYPDRVARRRHSGGYQLANGRSADLPDKQALGNQAWLAIAEVSSLSGAKSDTIRAAVALDEGLFSGALAGLVQVHTVVEWDNKAGRFIAEEQHRIGVLVWQRKALPSVPAAAKSSALVGFIRKQGLDVLPWQAEQVQWCARVNLLRTLEPQHWPDVSRPHLLATLEDWLAPYLETVNSLADFKKLDLGSILSALLPWDKQQRLEQLAPQQLEVPSGHAIAIDYSQTPPVLAVKLQEMFGCQQTPTLANGKVALIVHLLSPAGRPLQITQDLAGFWRTSYHDVKKDMKGRYPKHPWPDDPLQAVATRKTKQRQ